MNRIKALWNTLAAASASAGQESFEPMANFTPRAQQVLALARKEADRFNHNFVGTEHVLLGLLKLGQGVAVNVLQKLGLDLETVRLEVEKQVGTGPDQTSRAMIPYTPRVKKVLALAAKEASMLNHTYVGTEHILLGLLREGDGVASRVLLNLGVDIEKTRQEILKELDPNLTATDIGPELSPANAASMQPRSELPQNEESPEPQSDTIDTSKRYDVYCTEHDQEVVVYRNALFKGAKALFPKDRYDTLAKFVELEQADGQTVFVALYSVIRFCEPGATPNPETAPGKKP
jgi:Clp amino terminal domain, pathogenicity island component